MIVSQVVSTKITFLSGNAVVDFMTLVCRSIYASQQVSKNVNHRYAMTKTDHLADKNAKKRKNPSTEER